jgi:hypothetical protein
MPGSYDAAMAAARRIAALAGIPATPERIEPIAFLVLEAVYEAECRQAGRPTPLLCGGCLSSFTASLSRCPSCGTVLRRADPVSRN